VTRKPTYTVAEALSLMDFLDIEGLNTLGWLINEEMECYTDYARDLMQDVFERCYEVEKSKLI
jgi:hypothetical protein